MVTYSTDRRCLENEKDFFFLQVLPGDLISLKSDEVVVLRVSLEHKIDLSVLSEKK